MSDLAFHAPNTDPTPIFDAYRGSYGTEILVAAIAHLGLCDVLARGPLSAEELRHELALAERPTMVLTTTLRAMGILTMDDRGRFGLTAMAAEHLVPGGAFYVGDYVSMTAQSAGVLEMVRRLKTNRPAGTDSGDGGAAFIFRDGLESAMAQQDSARNLTLALAGRAKNVAPVLAQKVDLRNAKRVVDVAGGTGIYLFALLRQFPHLRGVVFDGPEVLKVAAEFAGAAGVSDRVELVAGDMFADPLPADCDVVLLSNVLHDWDFPECHKLLSRCAAALPAGGRLLIHDVFLNDALDGPLAVALYSAALFAVCEGRAYSAAEYGDMLRQAGLEPSGAPVATLIHCGVIEGIKR